MSPSFTSWVADDRNYTLRRRLYYLGGMRYMEFARNTNALYLPNNS